MRSARCEAKLGSLARGRPSAFGRCRDMSRASSGPRLAHAVFGRVAPDPRLRFVKRPFVHRPSVAPSPSDALAAQASRPAWSATAFPGNGRGLVRGTRWRLCFVLTMYGCHPCCSRSRAVGRAGPLYGGGQLVSQAAARIGRGRRVALPDALGRTPLSVRVGAAFVSALPARCAGPRSTRALLCPLGLG